MYIKSDKIKLFPLAKARESQRSSRIFYEETTSGLIRNFTDTFGFIIKNKDNNVPTIQKDPNDDNKPWKLQNNLMFNIYGYYVTIKSGTILTEVANNNYIYASIKLSGGENIPYEIEGQDDGGLYKGLELKSATEVVEPYDSTNNTINLILFAKDTNENTNETTYKIYEDSYQKIDISALSIIGIDGKN